LSESEKLLGDLERFFKDKEIFSQRKVETEFLIVRCDGHNFRKLSKRLNLKRFDARFNEIFVKSAMNLMRNSGFDIRVAFVASDEVSFLFKSIPFNGRVEKIDSVIASLFSSIFTIHLMETFDKGISVAFDARVIALDSLEEVVDYFLWRQNDIFRNFLNSWAQEALLQELKSMRKVSKALENLKATELIKIIEKKFGSLEKFPDWQRLGTFIFSEWFKKEAVDIRKGKKVEVIRRRFTIEHINCLKQREYFFERIRKALSLKPKG